MSFTPPPPCTNGKHPVAEAARFLGLDPGPAFDQPEPMPKPASKKAKAKDASPGEPKKDRDAKGKFVKGNPGGPGNPYARKIAALRQSLIKHLGPRELYEIVRLLVGQAMCGNIESTKVLFQYVIGKAPDAPDPDGVNLAEWQQYVDNPATAEAVTKLLDTLPHEQAVQALRGMWPAIISLRTEMMKNAAPTPGTPGATASGAPEARTDAGDAGCPSSQLAGEAGTPGEGTPWGESTPNGRPSPNGEMKTAKSDSEQASRPSRNGASTGDQKGREMPPPLPVGNPYMRRVAELRRAVVDAVNERDMEYIGQLLMSRAMVGHLPSTKLLFRYVLGKPTRPPDPDTLDLDEFRRLQQSPVTGQALNDALNSMPHDFAVALVNEGQKQAPAAIAARLGIQV